MIDTLLSATDVCEQSAISYRQLDWWIRHDAIPVTDDMANPGSGNHRRIPAWYIPRLRLLGEVQRSLGSGGAGGINAQHLRNIFENYHVGSIQIGPVTIAWDCDR